MAEDNTQVEEKQTFTLDNGAEGSRSQFIRQEFKKDRSRGDIAKQLGVSYSIVYTATANMYNAVHKEDGSGVSGSRGQLVTITDEDGTEKTISRAEFFRMQVKAGKTRGELAKEYNVPYATVYAATKELTDASQTGGHGRVMVQLEDGTQIGRAEYIRKRFAELTEAGDTNARRTIANELKCDYAVVWAATATKKPKAEATSEAAATSESATGTWTAEQLSGQPVEDTGEKLPEVED